jgi:hypothetical protein
LVTGLRASATPAATLVDRTAALAIATRNFFGIDMTSGRSPAVFHVSNAPAQMAAALLPHWLQTVRAFGETR